MSFVAVVVFIFPCCYIRCVYPSLAVLPMIDTDIVSLWTVSRNSLNHVALSFTFSEESLTSPPYTHILMLTSIHTPIPLIPCSRSLTLILDILSHQQLIYLHAHVHLTNSFTVITSHSLSSGHEHATSFTLIFRTITSMEI